MTKRTGALLAIVFLLFLAALALVYMRRGPGRNAIPVGAILPLTGDVASYGIAVRQGIELAVEKVNREGGIGGRPLYLAIEDDKGDPKQGVNAAQKLMAVDRVPIIIGAVPSSVTLAIAPVAEQHHVVLLSPASSSPKITTAGDYIFRNYPSDELEGKLTAHYSLDRSWSTAAVLTINNDYGNGLNEIFSATYSAGGGHVLLNDRFAQGTTDFRTLLAKVNVLRPQVIFIVGYGKDLGTLIRQARELNITTQFLSTVNFQDSETLATGGTAVEGTLFSSPIFDPSSSEPLIRNFVESFKQRFGRDKEPDVWVAHGFDAVLLVAKSMRQEGTSSDAIKNGLYRIRDFPGVSGTTSFDHNGDVEQPARFMTVKGGRFVPAN